MRRRAFRPYGSFYRFGLHSIHISPLRGFEVHHCNMNAISVIAPYKYEGMWVFRTPEEVTKWQAATLREARSHGRLMGGMVWLLVSMLLAGGWFVSFRTGVVAQQGTSGSFWLRLPIAAAIALPFGWFVFRR